MRKTVIMVVAILTLAGCSSDGGDTQTDITLPEQVTTTDATLAIDCEPADADDVEAIERSLAAGADSLGPAFGVNFGEYRFVTANIYDGSERLSSADTWVLDNGVVTALSGSANDYSDAPDTQDFIDRAELQDSVGGNPHDVTFALSDCTARAGDPAPVTTPPIPTTPRVGPNQDRIASCANAQAEMRRVIKEDEEGYNPDLDHDGDGEICDGN